MSTGTSSTWTVTDNQIQLNGQPFFVKGVAYSPVPVGAATGQPQVGDWFFSTGQANTWDQIWNRDLPMMQSDLGVNVLKTYFFWPWAPPDDIITWQQVIKQTPQDHTPFLDACASYGIYVLIGVAYDVGNIFDNADPTLAADFQGFYQAVTDTLTQLYGSHPAVMGFVLGNEMNNAERSQRQDFWDINAGFASTAKQNAPDKLILQAFQNDPDLFTYNIKYANLGDYHNGVTLPQPWVTVPQRYAQTYDLWGMNIFNGNSFDPFWDRFRDQVINAGYPQPLLMSEYGVPAGTNDPVTEAGYNGASAVELPNAAQAVSSYLTDLWNELTANQDIVSGGTYFEYCDEWWKGNADPGATPQAQTCQNDYGSDSPGAAFPGQWWEPAWWGLYSVAPNGRTCLDGPWNSTTNQPNPPDTLSARAAVATMQGLALPSGYVGGAPKIKKGGEVSGGSGLKIPTTNTGEQS